VACLGLVGVLVISGCGMTRSAKDVNRLRSQVMLLDERVTQLERSDIRQPSAEFPADIGVTAGTSIPASHAAPSASSTTKTAASSMKPSTRDIQQALKNAGFYQGAVDGKRGPLTSEAIREFQRVHGLKVDGIVGRQTWAQLGTYEDLASGGDELHAAEILK